MRASADGIDGSEIQIENHLPQPERCTSRHDDDETARRGTFPSVRRVRSETDPRNAKKSRPLRTAGTGLSPTQTRPGPVVQFDTCPATEDSPRQANHVRGSGVS
jgi:hypothetical protein